MHHLLLAIVLIVICMGPRVVWRALCGLAFTIWLFFVLIWAYGTFSPKPATATTTALINTPALPEPTPPKVYAWDELAQRKDGDHIFCRDGVIRIKVETREEYDQIPDGEPFIYNHRFYIRNRNLKTHS